MKILACSHAWDERNCRDRRRRRRERGFIAEARDRRPGSRDLEDDMKVGILGTGHVAAVLGSAWHERHEVTLGSRDLAKDVGFTVRSLTETIRTADVVVNAILGSVAAEVISGIPAGTFGGKTLIDVANATTPSFDLLYPNYSLAEKLQQARPDARVVKTLNCAAITTGANPSVIGPSSVFLSGDSADAKREAAGLLKDLGWADDDIVDLGGIETARGPEHYLVLFAKLAAVVKTEAFNIKVVR
jgi:8-hydroxy-5-deazaflavin:NADPH oxidoreductase